MTNVSAIAIGLVACPLLTGRPNVSFTFTLPGELQVV